MLLVVLVEYWALPVRSLLVVKVHLQCLYKVRCDDAYNFHRITCLYLKRWLYARVHPYPSDVSDQK